jgi:hypothetical protein
MTADAAERVRTNIGPDYALDAGWPFKRREARPMIVPDLRTGPPRRWNAAIDGVLWLPRLADKARACDAGTLGGYLYGQSPMDDSFLRRAGLDYAGFMEIARMAPDDAAVLTAIEAASPGATERLRRWSVALPRKQRWFLIVLDMDEGHAGEPAGWKNALRVAGNAAFAPLRAILRLVRPVKL